MTLPVLPAVQFSSVVDADSLKEDLISHLCQHELNHPGTTIPWLKTISAEKIHTLLNTMIPHMAPNTTGDIKKQHLLLTCITLLEHLLKDHRPLPDYTRAVAQKMRNHFETYLYRHSKSSTHSTHSTTSRPAVLDTLLRQQKTFLPSWKSKHRKTDPSRELEKQLDEFSATLRQKKR